MTFTISVGVSVWEPGETLERLLARADRALYEAKNSGRNRVCVAAPVTDEIPDALKTQSG